MRDELKARDGQAVTAGGGCGMAGVFYADRVTAIESAVQSARDPAVSAESSANGERRRCAVQKLYAVAACRAATMLVRHQVTA